jgi:arylsulfatase A-like enzyme
MTPFKGGKGTAYDGGFRVPAIIRWPGHVKPGSVENRIFSGLDWFPTLVVAAGNPDITDQLLKGVKLGDRTYTSGQPSGCSRPSGSSGSSSSPMAGQERNWKPTCLRW